MNAPGCRTPRLRDASLQPLLGLRYFGSRQRRDQPADWQRQRFDYAAIACYDQPALHPLDLAHRQRHILVVRPRHDDVVRVVRDR